MTQALLLAATISLGIATLIGWIGPLTLLAPTFLIGAGFTFYMPAQQASVNDLVSRQDLPRAIALSAVAFNVAPAVGAALAGAIPAWIGTGSASIASACFFVVTIVAVSAWKRQRRFARRSRAAARGRVERPALGPALTLDARTSRG